MRTYGADSGRLADTDRSAESGSFKVSEEQKKLSFWQVLGSVTSSFLGVQKNERRERDFRHGRARDFIMVGVLLTMVFVLAVWGVVQLVMSVAAPTS